MNWLKNLVPPKLRSLVGAQKEISDNLWYKCPGCTQMIYHRDLDKNLHVCQHCGHHLRIRAEQRLKMLFDNGKFALLELGKPLADPLKFRDLKKYSDRIRDARSKTGETDALKVGLGEIGGHKTVIAVLDFAFMGGSMGMAVGDGLITAARRAVSETAPLVVIPSSGGARMQEGILSLMQMTRSTIAVEEVKEAGLPYIVVLTDPTTGGVTASFAMLGDIQIAEPGSQIGFAGKRVIEQTIRETLPDGFQQAEYLLEHGMIDMVVHRQDLAATLARIIGLLHTTNVAPDTSPDDRQKEDAADAIPSTEVIVPDPSRPATKATDKGL